MRTIDLRKKDQEKKAIPPVVKKEILIEHKKYAEEISSPVAEPVAKSGRLEWDAPSFYHNPQKKYLVLVVIALFCGAGATLFFTRDILMTIFLILSPLVLLLYANKRPTISKVIISPAGVTIDDKVYYYKDLKSFWLDYDPNGPKELSLEARQWHLPYIKISTEDQSPVEIRALMINFIREREHERSLIDFLGKKLGL